MRVDETTCRELLGSARVARLGTASRDGRPHLVPVTFALIGDRLVTAIDRKPKSTSRLRRLRNIDANPRACVLVDHYDDDWRQLWWVRVDGLAAVLEGPDDREEAVAALSGKYPQYRDDPPVGPVIVVEIAVWTGWSYQ